MVTVAPCISAASKTEPREMVDTQSGQSFKEGRLQTDWDYSAVKCVLFRTKHQLRGRGGCYNIFMVLPATSAWDTTTWPVPTSASFAGGITRIRLVRSGVGRWTIPIHCFGGGQEHVKMIKETRVFPACIWIGGGRHIGRTLLLVWWETQVSSH